MSDEVKIVITLKGQTASIGVQKPDCDPVFSKVEGDLAAVLKGVPRLVEEAQKSWESNSRYPKCETPLTPPAAQSSSTRQRQTAPQTAMF